VHGGEDDDRWLVVGLGNPGTRYCANRHNIGFALVDVLAEQGRLDWRGASRFGGQTAAGQLHGRPVLLLKPQTYMNLSGDSVAPAARCLRIPVERIVVVHDDVDLALGRLKVKRGGGAGGHRGLRSVTEKLGSPGFVRIRFGVGRPSSPDVETADYVLSDFLPDEQDLVAATMDRAIEAIGTILTQGVKEAMNRHNRPPAKEPGAAKERDAAKEPNAADRADAE